MVIGKKITSIFLFLIFILMLGTSVVYCNESEPEVVLQFQDKGKQFSPSSNVHSISMAGSGSEGDPFVLWYEDREIIGFDQESGVYKCVVAQPGAQGFEGGVIQALSIEGYPSPSDSFTRFRVVHLGPNDFGMYLIDQLTNVSFSRSSDGINWCSPVAVAGISKASGIIEAKRNGSRVYLYWVDDKYNIYISRSPGSEIFTDFTEKTELVLNNSLYSPTGGVLRSTENGQNYYLFFVTKGTDLDKGYVGLAVSENGWDSWTVLRGSANPLLRNQWDNREDLFEVAISNGGVIYNMFYTGNFKESATFEEEQVMTFSLASSTGGDSSMGFASGKYTVYVKKGAPGHFQTIQEAVNSNKVKDGYRIEIWDGNDPVFNEAVTVTKSLEIVPHKNNSKTIEVNFSLLTSKAAGFDLQKDNTFIGNFLIKGHNNSSAGILVSNTGLNNLTMSGTQIQNVTTGISLTGLAGSPLRNVTIENVSISNTAGAGIFLNYTNDITVKKSKISAYGSKALVSLNSQRTVNAEQNWWGANCPLETISGDVNFTPWYTDEGLLGLVYDHDQCGHHGIPTFYGENVVAALNYQTKVTFTRVTSGGFTEIVSETPERPAPDGYEYSNGHYNISTTAVYSGDISITLPCDPSAEGQRMFQWTNNSWVDITDAADIANSTITGRTASLGLFTVCKPVPPPPQGNTEVGNNVVVDLDIATIKFANVSKTGDTSVTPGSASTAAPTGYQYTNGVYEISTTAEYSGPVELQLPYNPTGDESLMMFRYDSMNGVWVLLTTTMNPTTGVITGVSDTLGLFTVCKPVPPPPPPPPPPQGNTPPGSGVSVTLERARISFNTVDIWGDTSAAPVESGSGETIDAPAGYRYVNGYYDITTTAEFSDYVYVTLPYGPEYYSVESHLRLFHYTGGKWEDITYSRSTSEKTITGRTISFSPFAVCAPLTVPSPGYGDYGTNTNGLLLLSFLLCLGGTLCIKKKAVE